MLGLAKTRKYKILFPRSNLYGFMDADAQTEVSCKTFNLLKGV